VTNKEHTFPIEPGPWSEELRFSSPVHELIVTVRDRAGERLESGLPDDWAVDVDNVSYPVRSKLESRHHMQKTFGYSDSPEDLDTPGGQDAGVIALRIDIPSETTVYLHATWAEAMSGGSLTIMALP